MPKFALFVCGALFASRLSVPRLRGARFPASQSQFDYARRMVETYEFAPFTVNGCAAKLYTIPAVRFGR